MVGLEEQHSFRGRCIVFVRGDDMDVVLLLWLCEICILLDLCCRFWCNMLGVICLVIRIGLSGPSL
jgi:hypothetical protein